ncbi:nucleotidyltransferase domain-containing protein [Paenibacillus sp. Leaf72]|uniref:nucleotidyltransferase domain-containing protein n=1 Tax=Paenibacillus sp. Leaf72 TaxID=1736234 RepID=UPI0006FF1263|nr:nucleotidyltransferase domain-containing protein [Paenibacillus sp. Leaf72]KQO18704.1 oxalate:formate antiporter [Paenibacillus sp. Leaf72]
MFLPVHKRFLNQAKEKLSQDQRVRGLLAGGSMMTNTMDEYSDLDLIIVYDSAYQEQMMNQRLLIAEGLGKLLSGFTGEHVGEPRVVICLYGPEPLHVDLKFVTLEELEIRIENPLILWEKDQEISHIFEKTAPSHPYPDAQWIEDRFWVWVHYGATKLGRGEWFELIDHLTFIRGAVLGPLVLMKNGQLPRGVRKLEQYGVNEIEQLKKTIPSHHFESCYHALKSTIDLYKRLRQQSDTLILKEEAEQASMAYLEKIYASSVH